MNDKNIQKSIRIHPAPAFKAADENCSVISSTDADANIVVIVMFLVWIDL